MLFRSYTALSATDPLALPWIRAHLDRLGEVLDALLGKVPSKVIPQPEGVVTTVAG